MRSLVPVGVQKKSKKEKQILSDHFGYYYTWSPTQTLSWNLPQIQPPTSHIASTTSSPNSGSVQLELMSRVTAAVHGTNPKWHAARGLPKDGCHYTVLTLQQESSYSPCFSIGSIDFAKPRNEISKGRAYSVRSGRVIFCWFDPRQGSTLNTPFLISSLGHRKEIVGSGLY